LGGNALALVSLASLKELNIVDTDIELLRGIGRFILHMMDEQGDFPSHYFYQNKGFDFKRQCAYYPGEAALALIKLYTVDPDIKWLESSRKILEFLAKKHLKAKPEIIDHWFMIATQHIFKYQDIIPLKKKLLLDCSVSLAHDVIVNGRENWCNQNAMIEGLTATCLVFKHENGLGHYYPGYENILEELAPHLIEGTKKLMMCQTKGGGIAGELWDVGTDHYKVRIDNNQHTMSLWIRTHEFLYGKDVVPKY